jgi:ligand-binding sensor domain-containing protein
MMVACGLICGEQHAIGQVGGSYLTETWTSENGLPVSSVTSIAQTPDGYLWVGTYNGLARFDGLRFKPFDPENTPALAHARIRRLHLDKQGGLWINTFDGSLTRFREVRFSREWTGISSNDRDATLVASSSNSIAFILDRGDYFQKHLNAPAGVGWQLKDTVVSAADNKPVSLLNCRSVDAAQIVSPVRAWEKNYGSRIVVSSE